MIFRLLSFAQQPDIVFHHTTEKEGLSYNIVNTFLKDSRGMLWIGTYNGLNKYDGAHFFKYHSGYGKNTLPNNTVHDLAEDKGGNIWGATENGVFCLNPITGNFRNYALPTKLGMTAVFNIFVDKEGVVWAANYFNLTFLNADADSFQQVPAKGSYPNLWIRKNGMAESLDGKSIYLATKQGLVYYDKVSKQFVFINEMSKNNLTVNVVGASALCKTFYGHYWYADNDAKTIIGFDPNTRQEKYSITTKEITKSFEAATLFEDHNHMLWVSTWGNELYMIDYLHENKVTRIRHNKNDVSSVAGDFFWDAMQEADGTLWLGTVGGISKCNPSRSFYKVHRLPEAINTIQKPAISFLTENPLDKTWWLSTAKQVLVNYNPSTSKTITYDVKKFFPDKNKKSPAGVNRMIFLKDSILVFSRDGAWIKKTGAGNFTPLILRAPYSNWRLTDVAFYGESILYCISIDKLLRWDLQTGNLDSLAFSKPFMVEDNRLFLGKPNADSKGKVWMLNGSNWLTYTEGDSLKPIRMNYQDSTEADDGYFTSMIMDQKGDLWMAKKGDGLIYYSPSKNISKQFKQVDGLVMDHIMAVDKDGEGKIWSACYNQFSVYNPLLNSFYNFTLPLSTNNYGYVNYIAALHNGNIIANVGGDVVEFFTGKLKPLQIKDRPLIGMLSINEGDSNYYSGNTLHLSPIENSLRIKFGMLTDNLATPYNMLYILDGADKKWSISTENFEANYNSLLPGTYSFRVKALAKDRSWQTGETVLKIHIANPFYTTWWFFLLMASLLVSGFVFFYRFKIDKQRQIFTLETKAESLEKEKTMIQYESLKQQLNPHFLFNSLTSLRSLIKTDSKTAAWFLDGLSKVYRYVLRSADQQLVLVKEEIAFVTTFAELQKVRFGEGFQVNIHISDNASEKQIAPVVLQNLFENAIKHNTTAADSPLVIDIFDGDDYLHVRNNLQRYRIVETSNKQGLQSLLKLYSFYTEKLVLIEEDELYFTVSVPLL
jgi:ligand-binding sensor domain-containing protein